jgi:multidrug transporter EmrE-like cation transporter
MSDISIPSRTIGWKAIFGLVLGKRSGRKEEFGSSTSKISFVETVALYIASFCGLAMAIDRPTSIGYGLFKILRTIYIDPFP